jgi:hypothetical protein
LPDRITADQPRLDEATQVWRVPVILTSLTLGALGQVGEMVVSLDREEILTYPLVEEMRAAVWAIVEQHRESIVLASLMPIDSQKCLHAFVVIGFIGQGIIVLDPLSAERLLPIETFIAAWAVSHNLTILIECSR